VFRVTTYELQTGEYTGTTYALTLNNDLAADYFTMISGPSVATASRAANADRVRVTADPYSNFSTSTAANVIDLTRNNATNDWIGALTVIECLDNCAVQGFQLSEVLETTLVAGSANTLQTVTDTLSADHGANTVPFGARFGGGMETSGISANNYSATVGMKITKSATNQIQFERYGAENRVPEAGTVTTFVTEWGSDWTVQNVNVTGTNAGIGVDATGEYNTASITSVVRDNTWVWGTGHARDDGLGDGALGQVVTLGDGVSQLTNETLVAVGAEGAQVAPGRDFQVYVLENSELDVDHRFRIRGDSGSGTGFQELNAAVDSPLNTESYDNSATDVQYTEGYRIGLFYNTSAGTGQAYSRTGAWGIRHDATGNLNYWRAYAGQVVTGWLQSIDFGDFRFSNVETRQQAFRWRDDSTDLNISGGYLAAENVNPAAQAKNTDLRLRIKSSNFGTTPEDASRTYELEFARKLTTCVAVSIWTGVSDSSTDAFELYDSANISPDGETTTPGLLTNSDGFTYVGGEGREALDTTGTIGPLGASAYTELEYALRSTDDAVTGRDYCFRLFDATASAPLDAYTVYPELTIESTNLTLGGLGEAGTFTSAVDGGWTNINFTGDYETPVVVGTSNTQNGQNALVFEARNVTATSADMRVCESEGSASNGCDTHAAETVGYMIIDASVAASIEGIEAGTFTASGNSDLNSVVTNFVESFTTRPYVFANVNTVTSAQFPIEVVIPSTSIGSFSAGICDQTQGNNDTCDAAHGNETVGWVAIEPGNEPFLEEFDNGTASISDSTWTGVTFSPAFTATPALIVASQTDAGGQDVEIDEGRLVTTTGADIRYCEIDANDTCDTHAADTVAWQAIETTEFQQDVSIDQDGFRFYQNINSATPTTPLGAENNTVASVNNGDVLRIRVALQAGDKAVPSTDFTAKLQYGQGATCSAIGAWTDVGGLGSGAIWRGFNNAAPTDGSTLPSSLLDGAANTLESYEEANNSATTPNSISAGTRGEWDWVIENNGAANFTTYCFRMVQSDGTAINYTRYPQLTTSTGVVNLAPDNPANLDQQRTSTTQITVGEIINESSVLFVADVSDQNANDILQLCVEAKQVGSVFTNTEDSCGAAVTYTGTALSADVTLSGFMNGSDYHWQARVRDAGGLYSAWVSFGGNAESAADFSIDTDDPTGTVYDGATTSVDIEFNGGELNELSANWDITDADSGVDLFERSIGTSPGSTDILGWTSSALLTSFTETSLTLETSNIYYTNIRATDVAGNQRVFNSDGQQVAPTLTFSTGSLGVTFNGLNAGNSFTDTETTTLTTSTNARNGYVVRSYLTGPLESVLLDTIGGFDGGSYASTDTWQGGDTGYGYTSSDALVQGLNIFSPPTCPGGGSGGPCFAPFSFSAPGDIIADNPGVISGTPITAEQFVITHRVTTDSSQAQGQYQTVLIFNATAVY